MVNYDRLNAEMLPKIEKRLVQIRDMQPVDKFDGITDMLSNVSLSPDEKLKLRGHLLAEFGYPIADFNEVFACRFSLYMYEHVGRGR